MIVGHTAEPPADLGTYLFRRAEFEGDRGWYYDRACAVRSAPELRGERNVALALSGGGTRAIAFHLGCFRALHDRGILDRISVVSTVSGGSVIGALYAYGSSDFAAFDAEVQQLLRVGLLQGLLRHAFLSPNAVGSLATAVAAGTSARGADLVRSMARGASGLLGHRAPSIVRRAARLQAPLPRWRSRTTALQAALSAQLFGQTRTSDDRRDGIDVVINATELRTGTAFRFTNGGSGSTRLGRMTAPDPTVAFAVAASAAYPVLLPALDRRIRFTRRDGSEARHRVLLADGGLYDNLGTMCLEPGRTEAVSQHVYRPEYIIACDAGVGTVEGESIPYWWPTRMVASVETMFRRVQNSTRDRMHRHVEAGSLRGFIMPYLGQVDKRLSWAPPDLVPRQLVANYPTDFSPMSEENIRNLSLRGEQLTRLLIDHYCPEL